MLIVNAAKRSLNILYLRCNVVSMLRWLKSFSLKYNLINFYMYKKDGSDREYTDNLLVQLLIVEIILTMKNCSVCTVTFLKTMKNCNLSEGFKNHTPLSCMQR